MNYKNDLIETSRSHLGLGVDIGRAALQPVYVPIEKISEANLCDWVASALVGHCIQYHEGLLLRDRSESSSDLTTKDRARIHSVARRAWIACELGLVHLFSQKVGDDHWVDYEFSNGVRWRDAGLNKHAVTSHLPPAN